jgi:SAM-dependent methyltransferase
VVWHFLKRYLPRAAWRFRALGLIEEAQFWSVWVATKGMSWPHEFTGRLDPMQPLCDDVRDAAREVPARRVRILDVGAGPVTALGYVLDGKDIEITAVDPLAAKYARLLRRAGIVPPVPTLTAEAETLAERFAADSFDIVYARNSLDHMAAPVDAIAQMVAVTKPGGRLILVHAVDEAARRGYTGLHQWNLYASDSDFVIWNERRRVNVTKLLRPCCRVEAKVEGESLRVEMWKQSD